MQCIALHALADVLGYCSKPTLGVTLGLNSGSKIPLARGCRISPMHIMGYFQRLGTFLGMTPHQSTKGFKYLLGMGIEMEKWKLNCNGSDTKATHKLNFHLFHAGWWRYCMVALMVGRLGSG